MRSSSASGMGLVSVGDEPAHGLLDVGIAGAGSRVGLEGVVPVRIALAGGVEVEQGEAIEAFGVARGGADREPDGDVAETQRHAVRADAGGCIDDEPSDGGAAAGGEPGGEAADEGVGDDGGTLEAGVLGNAGEPAAEGVDIEMGDRSGLAEAGDVGHHDPVVPRQTGDAPGPTWRRRIRCHRGAAAEVGRRRPR